MHARFDDLIRLRSALRELPGFDPPPHAWERVAQQLAGSPCGIVPAQRAAPLHHTVSRAMAALAVASLAALVAAAPFWMQSNPGVDGPGAGPLAARAAPVDELITRSRQLEATLQSLPQRPAVEVAANAVAIDALQSRIRLLDAALEGDPAAGGNVEQARELWGARVQLLNSLVGVRYAEAVRAGYTTRTSQGEI